MTGKCKLVCYVITDFSFSNVMHVPAVLSLSVLYIPFSVYVSGVFIPMFLQEVEKDNSHNFTTVLLLIYFFS